ncbi:DEAD/DEAH box helicase [Pedobacter sp. SYP-B3415]|uniref:DEAD/DEAH box helicase n=1 Tax=Pedobacter sp. SYP-B3415 TaxID=2496641 RepID=UPI00101B5E7A|nr:DEAD/DEAH box helicase [Pedobacter sp. SYP-B3415]
MYTHNYAIPGTDLLQLSQQELGRHTAARYFFDVFAGRTVQPVYLNIDYGIFEDRGAADARVELRADHAADRLVLKCSCGAVHDKVCLTMATVLIALQRNDDWLVFFDSQLRQKKLTQVAMGYGMEHEEQLERYFGLSFDDDVLNITPKTPGLLRLTGDDMAVLKNAVSNTSLARRGELSTRRTLVVFKLHRFYKHLVTELYQAETGKNGKPKNPLTAIQPLELVWNTSNAERIKFFAALHRFQQPNAGTKSQEDLAALRAIVANPAGYNFFAHRPEVAEQVNAASITPLQIVSGTGKVSLKIVRSGNFYEVSGRFEHREASAAIQDCSLQFGYFILLAGKAYLPERLESLGVVELLIQHGGMLQIHAARYEFFRTEFLDPLGDRIRVDRHYIPPATAGQIKQQGFDERRKLIYLSDSGNYVDILPVMRYQDVEIPVRSQRMIQGKDDKGKAFLIRRDEEAEKEFLAQVIRQHESFAGQMDNDLDFFYLHRLRFMDHEWFLRAFGDWSARGIDVLGFDKLEGSKLNPNKVNVDIKVLSGINWFNAVIEVRYGRKKASLKSVYQAVRNRNHYVQLDDGTRGILPEHWINRFGHFFTLGEIGEDNEVHIPKVNFAALEQAAQAEELDTQLQTEIMLMKDKLKPEISTGPTAVPAGLTGKLRDYQYTGLNWLSRLDELSFGGCLADDMGLGKSIQILAFILSQRAKVQQNTNLLVVPATLIFNWQQEITRFAPSLRVLVLHGANRRRTTKDFDQYEIIISTYGSLLSDVGFLKTYSFNYIFLDESQNIKNPQSQRYKAARLLQARNRIAITGTPIENNTYDLYSQLSFACPGLLGSKQYFKDIYATPIDTFKVSRRALELQQRIAPFVLRRSKQEVAAELPEKTEMILYCSMGEEQRRIYDAYEREFREYIDAVTGEELKASPMNVLKGLTKLRQICNSPKLLGTEALTGTRSAKIELLMEQIASKAASHKILVFSQFVGMLNLIATELDHSQLPYCMLTGNTRNREEVVRKFQEDTETRVFLISLKAGGTGLNLTEADYVYLVDPWWNPAVENQAIDRAHRIGQNKRVVAVRLVCSDSVEEKILDLQHSKRDIAARLVPAGAGGLPALEKDRLLALLSQPPLLKDKPVQPRMLPASKPETLL